MSWFYAKDGQQLGPVDDSAWDGLVRGGSITPDTMVWRDGMGDWKPFREVGSVATTAALAGTAPGVCSQCGTRVPADELIMLAGQPVCAKCKPAMLQKLKEGVTISGAMVYAGFWIRVAAKFVDGIILFILQMIIGALLIPLLGLNQHGAEPNLAIKLIPTAVSLLLNAGYIIFFLGKYGATPGKMACRLKVVRPDGAKLTYGRAFGRWGRGGR